MKNIILICIFISIISCSVQTGSRSLADIYFTSKIEGTYRWTDAGLSMVNSKNNIFPNIPNPLYTDLVLFTVGEHGALMAINGNAEIYMDLVYTLQRETNSAVYQIVLPTKDNSGEGIKNKRYFKIFLDDDTNMFFSDFFISEDLADESDTPSKVAQLSYISP